MSRLRPQFSLQTLLLLFAVAALSIGLWQAGREVLPLREEIARLRQELGYFQVGDQTKIHIHRVKGKVPNAWQWRLFLPRSRQYTLHCFHGRAPDPVLFNTKKWCEILRQRAGGGAEPLVSGELSYEALLTRYSGKWWLRMGGPGEAGKTIGLAPHDRWLDDETAWVVSSDAKYESVATFDAKEPLILLHVEQSVHGSNGARDEPAADGQRLVIWVDSQ
jgi:hypothetical protein